MRMTRIRDIAVSGFTADANPNLTAPAAGSTYVMAGLSPGDQLQREDTEGHRICIRFIDDSLSTAVEIPGATADFRTWIKDDGASAARNAVPPGLGRAAFIGLKAEASAPSSQSYAATTKGEIFVQITAIGSVGAATRIHVMIEESTSVPG